MIEALPTEAFEALEATHNGLFEVETGQGKILFRAPTSGEVNAFRERAQKPNQLLLAQNELAGRAVVYPAKAVLDDLISRFPLFSVDIVDVILSVAKGNEEAKAKK